MQFFFLFCFFLLLLLLLFFFVVVFCLFVCCCFFPICRLLKILLRALSVKEGVQKMSQSQNIAYQWHNRSYKLRGTATEIPPSFSLWMNDIRSLTLILIHVRMWLHNMGHVKKVSSSMRKVQGFKFIPRMRKLSSGLLLLIHTYIFCSNNWFC